jgi:PadR family transcriptional regulator PadR
MLLPVNAAMMDACVLAALEKGDTYGYRITQELAEGIGASESTLYPVLRRLQKDGCLAAYDVAISGRNRRYYTLTDRGREALAAYRAEWVEYKRRIDDILTHSAAKEDLHDAQ